MCANKTGTFTGNKEIEVNMWAELGEFCKNIAVPLFWIYSAIILISPLIAIICGILNAVLGGNHKEDEE